MKMTIGAVVCVVAAGWLAGCAEQTVNTLAAGSLSGLRTGSVYVPVFEARPSIASEATTVFIADLSARSQALVVRGSSIAHDENPDIANGSFLPDLDAGMRAARALGATVMVVGEIETHRAAGGVTAVAVLQIITLADGKMVTRLRQECTAADERQAGIGVAKQAASVLAAAY